MKSSQDQCIDDTEDNMDSDHIVTVGVPVVINPSHCSGVNFCIEKTVSTKVFLEKNQLAVFYIY